MPDTVTMPSKVKSLIENISGNSNMNAGVITMMQRAADMGNIKAKLVGIANDPTARAHFEQSLDAQWEANSTRDADEVIIGGGFHAATYAAVRVKEGSKRPLVIEKRRVGGAFGMSQKPSFYLNSRNRPGRLSIPGQPGAINVLPGAPIQPADLSSDEYQRNTDLAFCIRVTLAMNAKMLLAEVESVSVATGGADRKYEIALSNGDVVRTDRIIIATGLGKPGKATVDLENRDNILTVDEFMARIGDTDFPLRGIRSVGVIGAGDGGKIAVEALVGQGPSSGWSNATLDYVERIDWYGAADQASSRERWVECNRSRYQGIGRLIPKASSDGFGERRLRGLGNATRVRSGYECAYVNEVPYDLVIDASGYLGLDSASVNSEWVGFEYPDGWNSRTFEMNGRVVGRRIRNQEIYFIGPVSALPLSSSETTAYGTTVPENTSALFRYAPLTAETAMFLGREKRESKTNKPIPFITETPRVSVGKSKNGEELFIGDIVRRQGYGKGPILGISQNGSVVADLDETEDGIKFEVSEGINSGRRGFAGSSLNFTLVKNEKATFIGEENSDVEEEPFGNDANGVPLYIGDAVGLTQAMTGYGKVSGILGGTSEGAGSAIMLVEENIGDVFYSKGTVSDGPYKGREGYIASSTRAFVKKNKQEYLGKDSQGAGLFVGDRVTVRGAEGIGTIVEGKIKEYDMALAAVFPPREADLTYQGGYLINGRRVWGAPADDYTKV